jgi:hypothetical protein
LTNRSTPLPGKHSVSGTALAPVCTHRAASRRSKFARGARAAQALPAARGWQPRVEGKACLDIARSFDHSCMRSRCTRSHFSALLRSAESPVSRRERPSAILRRYELPDRRLEWAFGRRCFERHRSDPRRLSLRWLFGC